MIIKTMAVRSLFAAAALSAFAGSANAFVLGIDPQIMINRAIDSPTLTVRYTGASATLVELRINGTSMGTRAVSSTKEAGETNFTLSQSDLHGGDNEVEIRLFDRTGKLIAKDHTNISTAPVQDGPVFLSTPKTGQTVRGPVEVNLGFDHELKDCYVSFFVDGSFKKMSNIAPFSYTWDSEVENNGWHELEAWAIDNSNTTQKTGKIRVFVDNPRGYTRRVGVSDAIDLSPAKNVGTEFLAGHPKSIKANVIKPTRHAFARSQNDLKPLPAAAPSIGPDSVLSSPAQAKQIKPAPGIAMGVRNMLPTHQRVAHPKAIVASVPPVQKIASADEGHHPIMVINLHRDTVANANLKMNTSTTVPVVPVDRMNRNSPVSHEKSSLVAFNFKSKHQVGAVISHVASSTGLIKISRGSRLPNLASFAIALDSDFIDFHGVFPRVDDGVPMTPLRFLLEKKGGLVNWDNPSKTVFAKADGNDLSLHIGDGFALLNRGNLKLERSSYLDRGRTIVPLSFMESALHVKIDYDKHSNHMLITSVQK